MPGVVVGASVISVVAIGSSAGAPRPGDANVIIGSGGPKAALQAAIVEVHALLNQVYTPRHKVCTVQGWTCA